MPILPLSACASANTQRGTLMVCDGNSLTDTKTWGGVVSWVQVLAMDAEAIRAGVTFWITAISGMDTAGCLKRAPIFVDPMWRKGWRNVYFLWEIANDLGHKYSADAAYQHIYDACAGRRAAGFEVWVATMQPANGAAWGVDVGEMETKRLEVNARIRANYAAFADRLIDLGAIPDMTTRASDFYRTDGVHLTNEGEAFIASVIRRELIPQAMRFPRIEN